MLFAGQHHYGRRETQAVVRPVYGQSLRNPRSLHHQYGVCRGSKKRAMVSARIETAHVEVPVVIGEHQQISLHHAAQSPLETPDQLFIRAARAIFAFKRL